MSHADHATKEQIESELKWYESIDLTDLCEGETDTVKSYISELKELIAEEYGPSKTSLVRQELGFRKF